MKASELKDLASDFENYYLYSPMMSEVKLDCDCGCGGDSYTLEDWQEVCKQSERAYNAYREYCEQNNIEWDY